MHVFDVNSKLRHRHSNLSRGPRQPCLFPGSGEEGCDPHCSV